MCKKDKKGKTNMAQTKPNSEDKNSETHQSIAMFYVVCIF